MTQEEKAKAYDEALNQAKFYHGNCPSEPERKKLEKMFPVLCESEDERIRKRLIEYFEGFRMGNAEVKWEGLTVQEVLAWLEKRKEQKPLPPFDEMSPEEKMNHPLYLEGFDTGRDVQKVFDEQKPEWSEEDENCIRNLESVIYYDKNLPTDTRIKLGDFLKSLRPQQRQEWSEEEKEILDNILSHYVLIDKPTDANGIPKEKYISLIKSIRFDTYKNCNSYWKPSEEQKYDGNMDKECIKLCDILNSIPSVNTFESCCGHLKDRFSVWFFCNDTVAISRLGRSVDRNYSDGKWELLVDSTDTHPTGVFWLRSKVPFQSYDEMEESVNELCVGIQYWFSTEFDSYFNGNSGK